MEVALLKVTWGSGPLRARQFKVVASDCIGGATRDECEITCKLDDPRQHPPPYV